MQQHRIRLDEDELSLICAALRARMAMRKGKGGTKNERLLERLEDVGRGNPTLRFGWGTDTDSVARCG